MKKITQTLTVPDNWKQKPMYHPVEIDGKWQRQKVQVEQIDLPALLKEQRELCAEKVTRAAFDNDGLILDYIKLINEVKSAPSPLDYQARSVDFNTEEKE